MSLYLLLAANLGDCREPLEEKAKQKKIRHRRKKKKRGILYGQSQIVGILSLETGKLNGICLFVILSSIPLYPVYSELKVMVMIM